MIRIILIALLSLFFNTNYSQKIDISSEKKNEWKIYKKGDVNVYYKITACEIPNLWDQERVLLKFENTLSKEVKISYQKELEYVNRNNGFDNPIIEIRLEPNSSVQGTCLIDEKEDLFIFSNSIDARVKIDNYLTYFKLTNFLKNE